MRSIVALTLMLAVSLIATAFLAVLAVIILFAPGCAHAPVPSGVIKGPDLPARLYCVEHDAKGCLIFRSAQPTEVQFLGMQQRFGVKSVIKLNLAVEGRDAVSADVERFEHPWLPAGPVDHDDIAYALDDLEHAPRPVLIHCSHGEDRTGLLIGLYRFKHGTWASAAYGEMLAFGFHPSLHGLQAAFERETNWRPDK